MGSTTLDIEYSQPADPGSPGDITLNSETLPASGRLDEIGDTVTADGFVLDLFQASVECTRTGASTMQVRLILTAYDPVSPYYCRYTERVIDDVPLSFP